VARFLLDTNILIPIEDNRNTPETYASLLRDLAAKGHTAHVHEASIADINRDTDAARRSISLSKLQKYPTIRFSRRTDAALIQEFGEIKRDNDRCDCQLLAAVKDKAVDFLVTEDVGLHTRARRRALDGQVLTPRQALDLINESYARVDFSLRSVRRRYCYELDRSDQIFVSLRQDYTGFDNWFADNCCAAHRECWVVEDDRSIAAITIFKEEGAGEAPIGVTGTKILKLCTFKVADSYRGGRLGEQMLRQAMCYAYANNIDSVYLTTYERQLGLRELIRTYGFRRVGTQQNSELVYAKSWDRSCQLSSSNPARVRRNYPQLPDAFSEGIIVPIRPGYHDRLFPEASARIRNMPGELFGGAWSHGTADRSSPSNSIQKAYLCFAKRRTIDPGTLIGFYRSTDSEFGVRAALTAVAIAESYHTPGSYASAMELVAKRTVYTADEVAMLYGRTSPLRVLMFSFYGYLSDPLTMDRLLELRMLNGPPQSIVGLKAYGLGALTSYLHANLVWG
jgi:hypothetical protein